MKMTIGLSIIIAILSLNSSAQERIIDKIDNKTWSEAKKFTAASIVFYQTSNGLIKAIKQLNGSGIPVVSSGIYDVKFLADTIILYNGLNLSTSDKLEDVNYLFNKTNSQINSLQVIFEESILFSWTKNKGVLTQIDVKRLSDIPIGTNEIYKEEDLLEILIDK